MPRPIVLDVDTGTDDALAILYAVRHPDLAVRAIGCVAGNSGVDQVVINTAKVLDGWTDDPWQRVDVVLDADLPAAAARYAAVLGLN
jgi:inosine-uridine nucleoside N-ribohydrolase